MKKVFATLFLTLWAAGSMWAAITALHIHTRNQGVIKVELADEPLLTFNDDNSLTIETPKSDNADPIKLYFDDIEKCEYNKTDEPDITHAAVAEASDIHIRVEAGSVTFLNLQPGSTVEVYDLGGRQVVCRTADTDAYTIDRSELRRGIYIVRIGSFATKLSL